MRGHAGMEQHRLFLGVGEQGFQLFAPGRYPGEVVPDLGSGHADP